MANLSEECKDHLEKALQNDSASEKDFHIRHVLQACGGTNPVSETKAE